MNVLRKCTEFAMEQKTVNICFLYFLTSALICTAQEAHTTQQVVSKPSDVHEVLNASRALSASAVKDIMQAEASKATAYMEGGPDNVTRKPQLIVNSANSSLSTSNSTNVTNSTSSTAMNNVMSRPFGREGVSASSPSSTTSNTPKDDIKPVLETLSESFPNDEQKKDKIKGRKGVDDMLHEVINATQVNANVTLNVSQSPSRILNNNSSITLPSSTSSSTTTTTTTSTTTTTTTTPKPIPKKPLVTVGNDDEPYAPSHFVSSKKNGSTKTVSKIPTFESYEYSKEKSSSSDYIVPIVGVILSVPLVSVVLNFVYKRTKEWWHHRHYSRMDFLIDGMYNN